MAGDLVETFFDEAGTPAIAAQENLLFVVEVMIKRWLGDIEPLGHVVERSPTVALLQE